MMFRILILIAVVIVAVVPAAPAFADDDDGLRAVPFVFVGAPGDCGPLPGSNIVTSAWLPGMGLPDNGDPNTAANAGDRRFGLLLNKNGLTTDCSAAGAEIKGVRGMRVTNPFVLGFDYRNGTHCGGGAPRFIDMCINNRHRIHKKAGNSEAVIKDRRSSGRFCAFLAIRPSVAMSSSRLSGRPLATVALKWVQTNSSGFRSCAYTGTVTTV